MQASKCLVLGIEECLQCLLPVRRDVPRSVEVTPQATGVPPEISGYLGEASPKLPLFDLHAVGERSGLRCGA
jgi:hypothetical protein